MRGFRKDPRKGSRRSGEEDQLVLVHKAERIHSRRGSTRNKLLLARLTPARARVSSIACAEDDGVVMNDAQMRLWQPLGSASSLEDRLCQVGLASCL